MPAELDPMVGPGRERPVAARWVVVGTLVAESALHLGGEGDLAVDAPILRDPVSGRPLLPGTSLAGGLRSHLADRLGGYFGEEEPRAVAELFGGARGNDEGLQSPLVVFDSLGTLPEGRLPEIRDGVAIEAATGTAEAHKKFDLELLPTGTRFDVRFELLVPGEEGADEARLLAHLRAVLSGLEAGEIPVGARATRGLGRCRAAGWRAGRFDLRKAEGWRQWLASDPLEPLGAGGEAEEGAPAAAVELQQALRDAWPEVDPLPAVEDRRRWFRATLDLAWPRGGLLVRSPGSGPDDADVTHLHSAGAPVLPGTSLAGALRSRAGRIARVVQGEQGAALVERLFGPRHEGTTDSGVQPASSRLTVGESHLAGGVLLQGTRIRVDRFTGGVVDGALFDEEPLFRAGTRLELILKNPTAEETGLLLLLLKDLLTGDLPVGGTASVGRGVVEGTAELEWSGGATVRWDPRAPLDEKSAERLEREVQELHEGPSANAGRRSAEEGGP